MKNLITILLILVCLFCKGQRNHLVFEATFEGTNYLQGFDSIKQCGQRISQSTEVKREGEKSLKMSLVFSDTLTCADLRTQVIKYPPLQVNQKMWYGFSVYLSSGYPFMYDGVESFFQFFRNGQDNLPPLTLNYNGYYSGSGIKPSGKYMTVVQSLISPDSIYSQSNYTEYHYPLDTIPFNQWTDIVMNVKWSSDSTGYIRIWVNGRLRYIRSGANNYSGNYTRVGLDKLDWRKRWTVSSTSFRDIYFDEIRIGDSLAQYIDVAPGANPVLLSINDNVIRRKKENITFSLVSPAQGGRIQFNIPSRKKQRMWYELIAVDGRVVKRGELNLISGPNYTELDVAGMSSGVYFFALQSDYGLTVKKIIL